MVNGPDSIFIDKTGKIPKTNVSFHQEKRLKTGIDKIVSQVGRHIL
jgi:pilus assembly protein CpaF